MQQFEVTFYQSLAVTLGIIFPILMFYGFIIMKRAVDIFADHLEEKEYRNKYEDLKSDFDFMKDECNGINISEDRYSNQMVIRFQRNRCGWDQFEFKVDEVIHNDIHTNKSFNK